MFGDITQHLGKNGEYDPAKGSHLTEGPVEIRSRRAAGLLEQTQDLVNQGAEMQLAGISRFKPALEHQFDDGNPTEQFGVQPA
ncbi:MAG: hypothetical protein AB9869_24880 [Verrucomicrobiia bacterium]